MVIMIGFTMAAALTTAARATTSAPPTLPPTAGESAGFAQTSWMLLWGTDAEVDRDLDAIVATGAKWLRLDFDWQSAEYIRGKYNWAFIDRVVERAQARGLHILATPAYTPAWARPADTTGTYVPTDLNPYIAFVKAAAQRYAPQGVRAWEIWNEPNIVNFWTPRPDPALYASMLRGAAAAIRSVDPQSTVVSAGLAPAADASDGRYISPRTFLSKLYEYGVRDSFDAVGIHPYTWPYGIFAEGDWNQWYTLPKTYAVMAANGDGAKKMWATEYGAPTGTNGSAVSENDQARFVREAFAAWNKQPWAGPLFWYSFRDSGTDLGDTEQNFGLVHRDSTPKPALAAFTEVMAQGGPAPAPSPTIKKRKCLPRHKRWGCRRCPHDVRPCRPRWVWEPNPRDSDSADRLTRAWGGS